MQVGVREELLEAILADQGQLLDHVRLTASVQQLTTRQTSIATQVQVLTQPALPRVCQLAPQRITADWGAGQCACCACAAGCLVT